MIFGPIVWFVSSHSTNFHNNGPGLGFKLAVDFCDYVLS